MTDPMGAHRTGFGSSLGDQDVFLRRHGRTFTIVITAVSAVAVIPVSVTLFLLSGVVDDDGGRWGMRVASLAVLGLPAFIWGVSTFIIRVRSGWWR